VARLIAVAITLAVLAGTSALAQVPRNKARAVGAEKRVALVIGMSQYRYIPALDNPANDARLIANTLLGLGFTLVGGEAQLDLDKAAFDRAIRSFGDQLQGADVGLFYYAGHGLQVRGTNWLVPTSANPTKEADLDFDLVDAGVVLRQMEGAGTRLNLMILDACRNNPLGGRGLRAAGGGLAQMQAPEGTLISYATQPGNVALDGADGDSPYTKALASTLRKPGLDVFRLFNEVGLEVKRTTGGQQQPWVSSSPIDGDFYFAGPPATQTANNPAPPVAAPAADPAALELAVWDAIKNSSDPADFRDYLKQYPQGRFAGVAERRVAALAATSAKSASQASLTEKRKDTVRVLSRSNGLYRNGLAGDADWLRFCPDGTVVGANAVSTQTANQVGQWLVCGSTENWHGRFTLNADGSRVKFSLTIGAAGTRTADYEGDVAADTIRLRTSGPSAGRLGTGDYAFASY
jgi:Caspase domain